MDYMTLKEAAEKWGVTPRRVNYYCAGGRIPGAVNGEVSGVNVLRQLVKVVVDNGEEKELQEYAVVTALPAWHVCLSEGKN